MGVMMKMTRSVCVSGSDHEMGDSDQTGATGYTATHLSHVGGDNAGDDRKIFHISVVT